MQDGERDEPPAPEDAAAAHRLGGGGIPSRAGEAGSLQGQVAVVTGGGQGIGRAVCLELALAGAAVLVADIDGDRAARTAAAAASASVPAASRPVDVSNRAEAFAMVAEAVRRFGRLDVLVNNAAVGGGHEGPFHTLPASAWQAVLDVDLNGAVWCAQAALERMVAQGGGGRIVNISSVHGLITGAKAGPYPVAKAGLNMLTKCLAVEYAPHRIRVNAVAPGAIATPTIGAHPAPAIRAYQRRVPLAERGRPEDVAQAVRFLCTDLSRYVTGHVLYVDGGYVVDGTLTDFKPESGPAIR